MAVPVSIVIPSFNHAAFVVAAAESALAQTHADLEVIAIDDGSNDASLALLRGIEDPRLRVLSHPNRGLSATLNRGIAEAHGRFVKFLPSDDLLEPDAIARQLAAAEADHLEAVFSLPSVVDAENRPHSDPAPQAWFDASEQSERELLRGLVERNFLSAPGALFARELCVRKGGFDPSLRVAQDYDLWLRMLPACRARLLPERLVRVRWHGANQSGTATMATEAERAYALVGALVREGLAAWTTLFLEPSGNSDDKARAALALAAALMRSGLQEVRPFARTLVVEARSLGAPPPHDADLKPLLEEAPELARPAWHDLRGAGGSRS